MKSSSNDNAFILLAFIIVINRGPLEVPHWQIQTVIFVRWTKFVEELPTELNYSYPKPTDNYHPFAKRQQDHRFVEILFSKPVSILLLYTYLYVNININIYTTQYRAKAKQSIVLILWMYLAWNSYGWPECREWQINPLWVYCINTSQANDK